MESPGSEFPPQHLTLRDGRSVAIRAVRPDDTDAMRTALRQLSAEAVYSRFMAPLKVLPPALAERSVRPLADLERALVAVAVEGGEERIVGGARYIKAEDGGTCEFAVMLADGWHGAGLASGLMRAIIRDACNEGLKRMEGFVLSDNRSMLALARRLGFAVGPSTEGPSVKLVCLDLSGGRQDFKGEKP